jgi:hypothetical protein
MTPHLEAAIAAIQPLKQSAINCSKFLSKAIHLQILNLNSEHSAPSFGRALRLSSYSQPKPPQLLITSRILRLTFGPKKTQLMTFSPSCGNSAKS